MDFPVPLGDADEGVFRTFPRPKKSAKVRAHSRSELAAHSSSSTPGAYGVVSSLEEPVQEEKKEEHQVSPMPDSIEWVELCDDKGKTHFWNRRSNETAWNPIKVVWVGTKDSRQGLACQHVRPPSFASRVKEPPSDGVDVPVNMLYKFLQLSSEYGTFQLCYRDVRTVQFLVCG